MLGSTLLGTWPPWDRPALLLVTQLFLGAAGYLIARSLPDFQRFFMSEARATEMAEEQAFQEFYRNGLHKARSAFEKVIKTFSGTRAARDEVPASRGQRAGTPWTCHDLWEARPGCPYRPGASRVLPIDRF